MTQEDELLSKFEEEYVSVNSPRPSQDRVLCSSEAMLILFGSLLERKVAIDYSEVTLSWILGVARD